MIEAIKPGSSPALPEGFEAAHDREGQGRRTDPSAFQTKAEYLRPVEGRSARRPRPLLDGLSETDLDAPAPERMRRFRAHRR